MKEAVGELNTTVIIVVIVGTLAAFFFLVIWPAINNDFNRNSNCSDAICPPCESPQGCTVVMCTLDGGSTIECPYKG